MCIDKSSPRNNNCTAYIVGYYYYRAYSSSNTVAKPTAFDNSITEPQNISEVGSITTLTRSPVVDSLKSNCISSHLLINLASYITSPNPTPDVRFPCEVTDTMT